MPSDKVPGKSVFVGNIPYGVSEEQIIDIFGRVGQVVGFRLVHDKETGRPKGFGFLEYQDVDTAAAAVRNLNDYDISGRKLRVDWSNDSGSGGNTTTTTAPQVPDTSHLAPSNGTEASALPPLPAGIETTLSAPDAISQTLSAMPAPQLLDLISQMKGMVADNPAQVAQLFQVAPQLAYAIFQALLLLGLTDTSILGSIVQAAAASGPPPQPQQVAPPKPVIAPPPQAIPPPNPYAAYQPPQPVPTPQHQYGIQQPYQPPQPVAQPPQQAGGQEALIAQLMSMTREQIFGLPAQQRDQIIQLRAQLGNPVA